MAQAHGIRILQARTGGRLSSSTPDRHSTSSVLAVGSTRVANSDPPRTGSTCEQGLLHRLEALIADQQNVIQRARVAGRPADTAAGQRRLVTLSELRRKLRATAVRLHTLKRYAERFLVETAGLNIK